MDFVFDAACSTRTGGSQRSNRDNFLFDGRCLPEAHGSLPHPVTILTPLRREQCAAVFEGIGEAGAGEKASFAAADCLREQTRLLSDYVIPERHFLRDASRKISETLLRRAEETGVPCLGAGMAALLFSHGFVYICNLGGCRAFRLRDGEFLQVSGERSEQTETGFELPGPLFFGMSASGDDRPYIAKGELKHGDQYLLCTGGMTDVLNNVEIAGILENTACTEDCVQRLIDAAMQRGDGKSVTLILSRIH